MSYKASWSVRKFDRLLKKVVCKFLNRENSECVSYVQTTVNRIWEYESASFSRNNWNKGYLLIATLGISEG